MDDLFSQRTLKKDLVVALVCDAIYPYSQGGREFRYQALLPRLAEYVEMHVYTMHWWDGPSVYTDGGITYHAISSLRPMYAKGRRSTWQALHFGIACMRLLLSQFDVLDADQIPYFQLFVLRLVATLKRRPLIVTWHEVWSRKYWRHYLGWSGWVAWLLESVAMRLPDHIIAASPETAQRLRHIIGKRVSITTVPNGTDLDTIARVSPNSQACDLITVGRLMDHKRIDMLLDVIASLHARGCYITCRIIGDGPERETLQDRARELGIDASVEFRCDVTDQVKLFSMIKASKLFISLSIREGFGMAVLEAIACGTRVLTTSAPDNLAQHLAARYSRGYVCSPDINEIVNEIQHILGQVNQSSGEKLFTDSWVADYDWNATSECVLRVYNTSTEKLRANTSPVRVS
jgi:glycosyltransferase involved in cell wall biosynthesis